MEKKIRSLLLKTLGTEAYLGLVSSTYISLIKAGFLKSKYPELFYLKHLIKPGYVCLDIGANVGYYSVFLSQYAGKTGQIHSIEPVPIFGNVFLKNTQKFALSNIKLYRCALGSEKKEIVMGTPMIDGVFRHGLTKIVENNANEDVATYSAQMEIADELFADIPKIDFLKCDVEGYEVILFPAMIATLKRCKPIIQIEISSVENREKMIEVLSPLGYQSFKLNQEELVAMPEKEAINYEGGDFYFKVI
ncbi:MAG: FkbM family methyltransferase [Bacteroidia bacterium]|jgi:FkbM family methyltransferase